MRRPFRRRRTRTWECPCGNFLMVAKRRTKQEVIDRMLGEHYLQCPVAQADVGLRRLEG